MLVVGWKRFLEYSYLVPGYDVNFYIEVGLGTSFATLSSANRLNRRRREYVSGFESCT